METASHTTSKNCTKCSAALVLGVNWTHGQHRANSYTCSDCNAAKGRAFYAANKDHVIATSKQRRHRERDSVRAYWKEWRVTNKERLLVHEAGRRDRVLSTIEGRASRMFSACRARCRAAGIAFDLTKEWIADRLLAGVCEATGLPFDLSLPPREQRWSRTPAFAPSLDRIERGGGYTTENVRVTVFIFNVARSDFGDHELQVLAEAIMAKAGCRQ